MDLLTAAWIPATTASGGSDNLDPADVGNGRWRDLAAPRPDFQSAAYQFLIGLLQSAFAPTDRDEWSEKLAKPPSFEELARAFEPIKHAFLLENSGGPAFLQDLQLDEGHTVDVKDLIFEFGSDSSEFFSKPPERFALCESCGAHALITMQFNAPSGGRGTRTSVRGGGPVTTLLLPDTDGASLWERLWLNVIPAEELEYRPVEKWSDVLPWLAPTRRSDKSYELQTTPESVHPLQVYWSMSRRIRLDWSKTEPGLCSVCGLASQRLLARYETRHGGTNYEGTWMHPLSPYTLDAECKKPPIARKGQPGGLGYRDWLGLTADDAAHPAAEVVRRVVSWAPRGFSLRLGASGGDFDNMKLRGWYESVMPIYSLGPGEQSGFVREVALLIEAANAAAGFLNTRVREAWFPKKEKMKTKAKSDPAVRQSFWEATAPHFFEALRELAAASQDGGLGIIGIRCRWLRTVRDHALTLFDQWTVRGPLESLRLERVVTERGKLDGDLLRKKPMKDLWKSVRATVEVVP